MNPHKPPELKEGEVSVYFYLTPELVLEGRKRELKHQVGMLRKVAGLKPEDKINKLFMTFDLKEYFSFKSCKKEANDWNKKFLEKYSSYWG